VLRSESPSGKCAKPHIEAASNNRDYMPQSLYYCLFAPHVYGCFSSCTSRSWRIAHSMQCQQRGCNNIPSFLQRTTPIARSFCEGCTWYDLHILVTAPLCWRVSLCKQAGSIGESDSLCPMKRWRCYLTCGCLRHEAGRGFERWHCTIYCPQFLRHL